MGRGAGRTGRDGRAAKTAPGYLARARAARDGGGCGGAGLHGGVGAVSNTYKWIQWNRHKKVYDLVLIGACFAYLVVFVGVSSAVHSGDNAISPPVLLIRGLGTLAIVLLHVILLIGPMARLDRRFAALLYNRRHMGVVFFVVALLHGLLSVLFYGGFGVRDPASAVLAANGGSFASVSGFPFEVLGAVALCVFFVMAATSHDFWLANLGPRVWKGIHMCVYGAYWLVLAHVVLGAMQSAESVVYFVMVVGGAGVVLVAHVAAGLKEVRRDLSPLTRAPSVKEWAREEPSPGFVPKDRDSATLSLEREREGGSADSAAERVDWIDACGAEEMEDGEGRVVCGSKGRIALFRDGEKHYAMANECAHQGGPLGEGAVIDGCATCPWHGYQYKVEDGASPPPYEERVATHDVKVEGGRVLVRISANKIGGSER